MTLKKLRRNAPEVQDVQQCSLCGSTVAAQVTDHLIVGTPGGSAEDSAICHACGSALVEASAQPGATDTLLTEEVRHDAGEGEITTAHPRGGAVNP